MVFLGWIMPCRNFLVRLVSSSFASNLPAVSFHFTEFNSSRSSSSSSFISPFVFVRNLFGIEAGCCCFYLVSATIDLFSKGSGGPVNDALKCGEKTQEPRKNNHHWSSIFCWVGQSIHTRSEFLSVSSRRSILRGGGHFDLFSSTSVPVFLRRPPPGNLLITLAHMEVCVCVNVHQRSRIEISFSSLLWPTTESQQHTHMWAI